MCSRLYQHKQKSLSKKIVVYLILIILLGYFMVKIGFQFLINSAVFVNDVAGSNKDEPSETKNELFYGSLSIDSLPSATSAAHLVVSGSADQFDRVIWYINNSKSSQINTADTPQFTEEIGPLKAGENQIYAQAQTRDGKHSRQSEVYTVYYKDEPPKIEIETPSDGSKTNKQDLEIRGTTDPETTVHINNQPVVVDFQGSFSTTFRLSDGENTLKITAQDIAGNETEKELKVTYEKDE